MRIGYFGGTFDPPHRGHLAVAQAAEEQFVLDRVDIAPTGRQPLKSTSPHASFQDRVEMVRLLCADSAVLRASEIDAPRKDESPNYTVDTLRTLTCNGDEIFAIVGADSFLDLRKWREPEELLRLAEWIVVSRPGFSLNELSLLTLTSQQQNRVHLLQTVHIDISATDIRTKLAQGQPCEDALTPAVLRFIREHHLYQAGERP